LFTRMDMPARLFCPKRPASLFLGSFQLLLAVLFVGFSARANATTVGCSGAPSGTYDFPTLTAAIAGAPLSNNSITLYGTCTEAVVITGAQNLTISGAPGAVLADPGIGNAVLDFESSQNVALQTIKIQMASYPFYGPVSGIFVNNSNLAITSVDIEGGAGTDGIDINPSSSVLMLGNNLIENNNDGQGNGEGISVTGPSANLQIGAGPHAASCTTIQGNGDDGIVALPLASVNIHTSPTTCATIQNNGSFGVQISRNSIGTLSNRGNAPTMILSGNLAGAAATEYGLLFLDGPMLIQNNSAAGVWLRDSSANIGSSNGTLLGPTVQQNGSNTNPPCCLISGGISIDSSSNLFLQAGLVTNNLAPGIVIDDNSSMEISQANSVTVTQNPVGISVDHDSSLELTEPPSVTGNTNSDVVCSGFSTAHGDASGVGKMRCDTFVPGPGGPGGNGHHPVF
jgi:hypothetical protein